MSDFTWGCGGSPCQDFSVAGKQEGAEWTCKDCGNNYNPLEVHYTKRGECSKCNSTNIEKTRSSLIVELLRIIREKKPNIFLYENVKNLVGKKFKLLFDMFLVELGEYGYNCHYKVLNAKDYGVPQNRERVYLIIIKKELDNGNFKFSKPFDNGIRLRDMLDKTVEENFYISQDKVHRLITNLNSKNALLYDSCQIKREGKAREYNDFAPTLNSRDYKDPRCINVDCVPIDKSYNNPKLIELANCITAREDRGISNHQSEGTAVINVVGRILPDSQKFHQNQEVYDSNNIIGTIKSSHYKDPPKVLQVGNIVNTGNWSNPQRGRIYSAYGCSPSLNCCGGGGLEPKILQGAIRGRYDKNGDIKQQLEIGCDSYTNTITTVQKDNIVILDDTKSVGFDNEHKVINTENLFRIRKLTPKECFRLMGFSDTDFNNAKYEQSELSEEILKKHPNHKGKRVMEYGERIERMSNSQLYKQAGNSIVVDVLYYILIELLRAMPYIFEDIKLSSFFSGIGAFECALNRVLLHNNSENFTQPQAE